MVLFPRGWSEFFRLNTRRGDDMDSLYNVVKSFTGWRGFDHGLGFWQPPTVLNAVTFVLFASCCVGDRVHRADGAAAPAGGAVGVPGGRGVPVDEQGVESAVLAVAGAVGGAGAAAPANPVGVDDDRRAGVGAADALPVRRAERGSARAVVHHDGAAARHRRDRVVRVGDPADLPAASWTWCAMAGGSTTLRAGCSTGRPTRRRAGCPTGCGRTRGSGLRAAASDRATVDA